MKQKAVILGAGESGIGAALLAKKEGFIVLVSDNGDISMENCAVLTTADIAFESGGHTEDQILQADIVIKSPGIPDTVPLIQHLIAKGVEVISEIEFAFRFISNAKVIAITGTNGKTTTTLLAYHLLKNAGLDVAMGGNVGISLSKLVAEKHYDYYVVEVSSFQLDGILSFRPDVAVLLNITPDHLDRYENDFHKYVSSKFKITETLTKEECFVYCSDCGPISEELSRRQVEACLFAISASRHDKTGA
ncbi:MAG: UDP-N-acetylmuramoyl-L-alanine--D-glutamate ligase, partial [Cyclobacteriaceae bacterium]|nr:UDP-N-acetylmuramoyl-L-alanine--D-glutamate ligase [Cyclobacteriaceae bacterium HetDA_MAG_MS6]